MHQRYQRGQSLVELAVVFAMVVAALLIMKPVIEKRLKGRHLESAKQISADAFSPADFEIKSGTDYDTSRTEKGEGSGLVTSTIIGNETNAATEFVKVGTTVTDVTEGDTTTFMSQVDGDLSGMK